jgi:NDP-sugar pyrophosphorylase family protein
MILAAGVGSRLRPITDTRPKALVELNGRTLLELVIQKLQHSGYDEFVINVHHFAEQIIAFLEQHRNFGSRIIISDERDHLLDTGGGLKKVSDFFTGPDSFLLHNVDIITDLDLTALHDHHTQSGAMATVAVRRRNTSRYFLFDKEMTLVGWENTNTGEVRRTRESVKSTQRYAFSGVHIIDPRLLQLINEEGAFSMVDLYLRLSTTNRIQGFLHNDGYWSDAGKPEELPKIEHWLESQRNIDP